MARTGRPKAVTPRKDVRVSLLPEHIEMFEKIDFDPFTGRRIYARRNYHLDKALSEYFQKYYPEMLKELVDRG